MQTDTMDEPSQREQLRQKKEVLMEQRKINRELLDLMEEENRLTAHQSSSTETDVKPIKQENPRPDACPHRQAPVCVDLSSPSPERDSTQKRLHRDVHVPQPLPRASTFQMDPAGGRNEHDLRRAAEQSVRVSRTSAVSQQQLADPESEDDEYLPSASAKGRQHPVAKQTKPNFHRSRPVTDDPAYSCIVRAADSDDLVELACCFCGGNSTLSSRGRTDVVFFRGAHGVLAHIHSAHASQVWPNMDSRSVVWHCTRKTLTAEEADHVIHSRHDQYMVERVMAANLKNQVYERMHNARLSGHPGNDSKSCKQREEAADDIIVSRQSGSSGTMPVNPSNRRPRAPGLIDTSIERDDMGSLSSLAHDYDKQGNFATPLQSSTPTQTLFLHQMADSEDESTSRSALQSDQYHSLNGHDLSLVGLERPKLTGRYYSKECDSDESFDALSHRRKKELTHVWRIEETDAGEVCDPGCARCENEGVVCRRYSAQAGQQHSSSRCARCWYDHRHCNMSDRIEARGAAKQMLNNTRTADDNEVGEERRTTVPSKRKGRFQELDNISPMCKGDSGLFGKYAGSANGGSHEHRTSAASADTIRVSTPRFPKLKPFEDMSDYSRTSHRSPAPDQ